MAVEDWFCAKSATAGLMWRQFQVSQSETWTASVSKDVRDVFPNWSRQGIEASNDDHEDNNVINKLVQNVVRIMRWPDVFGPDGLRAPNVGDLQVAFHPFWKYARRLFSAYQSRGFMPKSIRSSRERFIYMYSATKQLLYLNYNIRGNYNIQR